MASLYCYMIAVIVVPEDETAKAEVWRYQVDQSHVEDQEAFHLPKHMFTLEAQSQWRA